MLRTIAHRPAYDGAHYALYQRYQHVRHPGAMNQDDTDQYAARILQSCVDTRLAEPIEPKREQATSRSR